MNTPKRTKVKRLPRDYKAVQGEIRTGTELQLIRVGRNSISGDRYMWTPCEECGECRWVVLNKAGELNSKICISCSAGRKGSQARGWKGGRYISKQGYIQILLPEGDYWLPMTQKSRRILEHRLVMAQHLGRCLQPYEHVHHKNGIRSDNRIENLELTMGGAHIHAHSKGYRDGYAKGLIDGRNTQIEELRKEVRLLHWQLKESERIK